MNATLLYEGKAQLGEGAIWDPTDLKLYWVDILAGHLHIYDPVTSKNITYQTNKLTGTVVPVSAGKVLLALSDGIALMNLPQGSIDYKIKTDIHSLNKRFNDGKCDPQGRFWVGTLTIGNETNDNKLYCIDTDFSMIQKLDGLSISNGIVWTADSRTMYHTDTPTGEITRYDFDKDTGDITNRQVIIKIPTETGYPDGMTIDSEGMLWIALWDGFCVARYNPNTGALLQKISVPAPKVTSCAFGGKNLDKLYITTASCEMDQTALKQHPLSGSLFVADVGISGVRASIFQMQQEI